MLRYQYDFLSNHVGRPLHHLIIPFYLFIDTYYRIEWFYLHGGGSWHQFLLPFFGAE